MSVLNRSIVSKIFTAFKGESVAVAKSRATQDAEIQKAVDAMVLACDTTKSEFLKGNAKTNANRAEVKALFLGLAEAKYISKATATNYQTSFWVAFEQNVPFQRDLFATANTKKTEGTSGASKKSGAVKSTTREALDQSINKVIEQANLLGLKGFALDLTDLAIEQLDGFKTASE
jgi:hypothetical protein